ncbi:MAG: hypothetical protein HY777_02500 [Betaproteobacteria bacterium]|nr:hypothetical protein [Betaproteobacteria bacterium]
MTRVSQRPSFGNTICSLPNGNVFAVLVDAVRYCSLGQITHALYLVGGQYRRSM